MSVLRDMPEAQGAGGKLAGVKLWLETKEEAPVRSWMNYAPDYRCIPPYAAHALCSLA